MFSQRIAYLDLSRKKVELGELPEDVSQKFLGGRGVNMYLLYQQTKPETAPLSPENPLIIGPGLLTGLKGIAASRSNISGKSPETGLLGDANIGGYFGAFMKKAGIAFLVITGASDKPVYLHLDNERVSIEDAQDLWGKSTVQANTTLGERHGPKSQSISIGVAGENLVRFACIVNRRKNAAARTGMGCLMGAKKIKSIVATGAREIVPQDQGRFETLVKNLQQRLREEPLVKLLGEYGSPLLFMLINQRIGMGRAYNGLSRKFPENRNISPQRLKEEYYGKKSGCYFCPVACHHEYRVGDVVNEGPEYTILGSFGPILGIKDLTTILRINDLINSYGLDGSSTANLIAWAIELAKEGLLDKSLTDGLVLDWGDGEAIIELIHQIAHRRGFGDLLAGGAKEAVQQLGTKAGERLVWTKYLTQTDPVDLRYFPAYALGDSVASRGADHLRSRPTWEFYGLSEDRLQQIYGGWVSADPRSYQGKGRVIWWWETYLSLFDALGLCKLIAFQCQPGIFDFKFLSELVRYATGLDLTPEEIFSVGERIATIERMFLAREGVVRKDDLPPQRYFEPLVWQDGLKPEERNIKLSRTDFESMLDEYYQLRGCDSEGRPLPETKQRLGLAQ